MPNSKWCYFVLDNDIFYYPHFQSYYIIYYHH